MNGLFAFVIMQILIFAMQSQPASLPSGSDSPALPWQPVAKWLWSDKHLAIIWTDADSNRVLPFLARKLGPVVPSCFGRWSPERPKPNRTVPANPLLRRVLLSLTPETENEKGRFPALVLNDIKTGLTILSKMLHWTVSDLNPAWWSARLPLYWGVMGSVQQSSVLFSWDPIE